MSTRPRQAVCRSGNSNSNARLWFNSSFCIFWSMTLTKSYPQTPAIFVNKLDASRFKSAANS